jgi:hypothetical protein
LSAICSSFSKASKESLFNIVSLRMPSSCSIVYWFLHQQGKSSMNFANWGGCSRRLMIGLSTMLRHLLVWTWTKSHRRCVSASKVSSTSISDWWPFWIAKSRGTPKQIPPTFWI